MFEGIFLLTIIFIIYVIYSLLKGNDEKVNKKNRTQHQSKRKETHDKSKGKFIYTHYDNLKVARDAPSSVIKAAYKALSQTFHPDKYKGSTVEAEEIMKNINASYNVLIDPIKRAEHDRWIREQESHIDL